MEGGKNLMSRAGGLVALAAAGLTLAACGSSNSSKTSSAPPNPAPASSSASGYGGTSAALTVGTAKGPMGTYLTGASGRALYIWVADSGGKSSCSGACASAWPPLTDKAVPAASGGAKPGEIGMITRSDGTRQVTYKGRPLYYYAGDSGAGSTKGQGSNQFGARWWLISPSGGTVSSGASASTKSAAGSSNASSSGTSTGSSSGSSSGWG